MAARICHGRSTLSEPIVAAMPPPLGRVTLRSILVNVHCLPLRWSSTVRLPPLRPISVSSRPSKPPASRLSIQAISAANSGTPPRAVGTVEGAGAANGVGAAVVIGATSLAGDKVAPAMTGVEDADAVTKGRLLPPANTVTLLSYSI